MTQQIIGDCPPDLQREIREAAQNTLRLLNIPADIPFRIECVEDIEDDDSALNVGECFPATQEDGGRVFVIRLVVAGERTESVLISLCHELAHLNQFYRGDLVSSPDGMMWRGESWTIQEMILDYDRTPWELEAKLLARPLYSLYVDSKRFLHKPWQEEEIKESP